MSRPLGFREPELHPVLWSYFENDQDSVLDQTLVRGALFSTRPRPWLSASLQSSLGRHSLVFARILIKQFREDPSLLIAGQVFHSLPLIVLKNIIRTLVEGGKEDWI